jgi:TetR/AcrR family transcriptional regulator
MVKNKDLIHQTTREKILLSAREVFLSKGMDGTRMQEIADNAGINKALLHYYFGNKESLFKAVFNQALSEIMPSLFGVMSSDRPLLEKIPAFFSMHMGFVHQNQKLPLFVITELTRNPDLIINGFKDLYQYDLFNKFTKDLNVSIAKGEIKPIEPIQLIVNLISLSIFPFIAKPVLMGIFNLNEVQYNKLLEDRKTDVSNFVINALK